MDLKASVRKGVLSGLRVLWELAKVIVPTMVVITLLDRTGVLLHLSRWLGPVMALFGLPGEAALALVMGWFTTFYGGLAALVALPLTVKQASILAAMIMINHAGISETALVAQAKARASWVLAARTVAMIVVGLAMNWLWP